MAERTRVMDLSRLLDAVRDVRAQVCRASLATSVAVDPNRSPITLMVCLMAVVIFTICCSGVMACFLLS